MLNRPVLAAEVWMCDRNWKKLELCVGWTKGKKRHGDNVKHMWMLESHNMSLFKGCFCVTCFISAIQSIFRMYRIYSVTRDLLGQLTIWKMCLKNKKSRRINSSWSFRWRVTFWGLYSRDSKTQEASGKTAVFVSSSSDRMWLCFPCEKPSRSISAGLHWCSW